jgi:hypothetical protein
MEKGWKWRIVSLIRNSRKGLNVFILFGLGFQWEAVVYLTHSWARMIWDAAIGKTTICCSSSY